jgi:large subunit ribosomal protein L32
MPNPKRRHSKQRTAKRRSHDFLTPTGVSICPTPNCGATKLPHTVCKKCGEYKGRSIVAAKEAV